MIFEKLVINYPLLFLNKKLYILSQKQNYLEICVKFVYNLYFSKHTQNNLNNSLIVVTNDRKY